MNLREYLKTTNLITDGAFGTYFAAKYQTQDIPELANITAPEKVKKIHEEYLNAGAKFIRTNTFASNTETLQEDFAEVEKNIQAAVEIARDAVNGRDAWIAGDIGPIPVNGAEDAAAAADEYYQIAKTFAEAVSQFWILRHSRTSTEFFRRSKRSARNMRCLSWSPSL